MNSQFWIFGGVISIVSHVLLLSMLFVFSSDGRQKAVDGSCGEISSESETLPDTPASPVSEYEVQAGDTLGAIARRIGCSIERLAEVNKSDVRTLSHLRIGQRLVLPD